MAKSKVWFKNKKPLPFLMAKAWEIYFKYA